MLVGVACAQYAHGMESVSISCECGELGGVLRLGLGNRVLCHCDDCQSYAHWLGKADVILDEHGGTDIWQTSQAHLRIEQGQEKLACMRLSPKGLMRWYASCCRVPVANMVQMPRVVPMMGFIAARVEGDSSCLGPFRGKVMGAFAHGDTSEFASKVNPGAVPRLLGVIAQGALRRDYRHSPFWTRDRQPLCTPEVISLEERRGCLDKASRPPQA